MLPNFYISLNGNKNITILLNDKYIDEGANAYINKFNRKEKINIKTTGNVNTKKIGKYIISYKAKKYGIVKEAIRIVNVVDNIKPEIILEKEVTGCKKNNLINYKLKAQDNYDGDLTNKVKFKIENEDITFIVNDSSNNKTELKEKIIYVDEEKPKIVLNGNTNISLTLGEEYIEFGAKATDSCDGDITEKVNITNNINKNKIGDYEVIYTVHDTNNNKTTIKRYVSIKAKENLNLTESVTDGTIYLTFDDGPGPYTKEILNVLKINNIKATFFVTAQFPKYQNLIKNIYEDGHSIGIHTYSHKWSIYESVESYLTDFEKIKNIIYEEIGITPKIFRFPGGSSNTISKNYSEGIMTKLTKLMEEKGYTYYDWTFDSGDTSKKNNSVDAIVKNFKKYLKGNGEYIVLMHDIKQNTLKALPEIITYGLNKGYKFEKITENTTPQHLKIAN